MLIGFVHWFLEKNTYVIQSLRTSMLIFYLTQHSTEQHSGTQKVKWNSEKYSATLLLCSKLVYLWYSEVSLLAYFMSLKSKNKDKWYLREVRYVY
jgi:hypothetical protein